MLNSFRSFCVHSLRAGYHQKALAYKQLFTSFNNLYHLGKTEYLAGLFDLLQENCKLELTTSTYNPIADILRTFELMLNVAISVKKLENTS